MKSGILGNDQYWDATGVYDSTLLKTQRQINAENAQGLGDLKSAFCKKVMPTVDLLKFAFASSAQYIKPNGALVDTTAWITYWLKVSDIGVISTAESYYGATGTAINQIAFYSSETPSASTFISGIQFVTPNAKNILNNISIPPNAVLCLFDNRVITGTDIVFEGTNTTAIYNYPENPFSKYTGKMQMLGYSEVNGSPGYVINTAEMYNYVGQNAYDGIKGDVRITSDNVLVMCHDAGFTFNGNGEIIAYNSSNCTLIKDMTFAQVQQLAFAQKTDAGADMHVPTFDDFVRICKKWGKFCFATIRDADMDIILPLMFETLDKYSMRENTIVNSMTYNSLVALREIDTNIPIIYTINVLNTHLEMSHVKKVSVLGNSGLGFFAAQPSASVSTLNSKFSNSYNSALLKMLKAAGIPLVGAIASKNHLDVYLRNGFDFVQTVDCWDTEE